MAQVFPFVIAGLIAAGFGAGAWLMTDSLLVAALATLAGASFVRTGRA